MPARICLVSVELTGERMAGRTSMAAGELTLTVAPTSMAECGPMSMVDRALMISWICAVGPVSMPERE
jgi:hypothetical protein